MKPDHLAMVLAPLEDGAYRVGTGYPVGPRQILTAAHVLRDRAKERPLEVWIPCLPGEGIRKVTDVWNGDDQIEKLDAAVLELAPEEPPLVGEHETPLRERGPDRVERVPWHGKGYASAGREKRPGGSWKRSPVDVGGHVQIDSQNVRLQAELDTWPRELTLWKGISGAPLFTQDGVLRAVLTEVPENFDGSRFYAVSLAALLRNENFRAAIRWDEPRAWYREVLAEVAKILRDHPKALKELHHRLNDVADLTPELVAERLMALPLRDLLKLANRVHEDLKSAKANELARAVYDVVRYVAPWLYDRGVIQIARAAGGVAVTLPVQSLTVAELVMAAAGRRSAAYRPGRPHPGGIARVMLAAVPDPNTNALLADIGEEYRKTLQALRSQLVADLGVLQADPSERERKAAEGTNRQSPQARLIDIELRRRADREEKKDAARLYLVLEPSFRDLARIIADEFKELHVVVLDAKDPDLPEEQAILGSLRELISRELEKEPP